MGTETAGNKKPTNEQKQSNATSEPRPVTAVQDTGIQNAERGAVATPQPDGDANKVKPVTPEQREKDLKAKIAAKRNAVAKSKAGMKIDGGTGRPGHDNSHLFKLPARTVKVLSPVYWGAKPRDERLWEVGEEIPGYTGPETVALEEPSKSGDDASGKAVDDDDDEND